MGVCECVRITYVRTEMPTLSKKWSASTYVVLKSRFFFFFPCFVIKLYRGGRGWLVRQLNLFKRIRNMDLSPAPMSVWLCIISR